MVPLDGLGEDDEVGRGEKGGEVVAGQYVQAGFKRDMFLLISSMLHVQGDWTYQ
jgi:hypothetical protein